MDQIEMSERLRTGETIYLRDDYEEACVRVFADETGSHTFLKLKGKREIERPDSDKKVFTILFDGSEISREEYRKY